ncbi:MAG TPA: cob(I)yrinic acid a,c-diamide adenosyltransferase [Planctomycetota bacterium]|nr:cob(I)yrinic acid a,c-diamide adenosyltransferase [Planctomycetota bacterium]
MRIDRVTTRTGDDGATALADGRRLAKDHPLVIALGAVDETSCALGLAAVEALPSAIAAALPGVQNDLFDLGADLAMPASSPQAARVPRIDAPAMARIEALIGDANARLAPLTSFVLPGGTRAAATLHLARAVARRAEIAVWAARGVDDGSAPSIACAQWLNRLSDLCFVWARCANDDGRGDVLWRPGGR